jgi:hypothetical protein
LTTTLPWTKLQDFYLRLGFLKLLAACLSAERRSVSIDSILRRVERPMFESVGAREALRQDAMLVASGTAKKGRDARRVEDVEVVECLTAAHRVPSALYAVTRSTAYKIIDWGRDVELLVGANQISERGLILKSLLPSDAANNFLSGDPTSWNPFVLTSLERMFFLFHALEKDIVTAALIDRLAQFEPGTCIETREASSMTCGAIFQMLEATERLPDAASIQAHRTALDLALTMAKEVEAPIPEHWARHAAQAQIGRTTRASMKRKIATIGKPDAGRRTTKNADHQTIPRFEQLVDLGFLDKPGCDDPDPAVALSARRRWRYSPTAACRRWAEALRTVGSPFTPSVRFSAFSRAVVAAFGGTSAIGKEGIGVLEVARRTQNAYLAVGRQVGMTPVDSIALRAMLDASAEGKVLEMEQVHRLLLTIKQKSLLTDIVSFAAGSALDTMFVRLKPSFLEQFSTVLSEFEGE